MASVEIIGVLCAGSTRYHEGGRSTSAAMLAGVEFAALLGGLSADAMHLALAKYAADVDSERKLIADVRVYAAGLAIAEGWQVVRGRPTVSNMAALAVFDVIRPNRCGRCSGTGFKSNRVCVSCNGSGFKPLSGRQMSEAIGVDEAHYRRKWKPRFESVYDYVLRLDSKVLNAVRVNDVRIVEREVLINA